MGAGKTTLGRQVAARLGRVFVDLDVVVEERLGQTIPEIFERRGEAEFRLAEVAQTLDALRGGPPAVLALGGGAVAQEPVRRALREHAFTVLLEVEPDLAWERVRAQNRPLAQDPDRFHALYEAREPLYTEAADARARTVEEVVLAAGGVQIAPAALDTLPGRITGLAALVTDPHVGGIYGPRAQLALGPRLASRHEVPAGEEAKTPAVVERLWSELELDRRGTLVALGGGCTTDVAGFAAATYLRGIDWVAVPTSLVGQVDAGIGGKTAIDLPTGKNLAGAFHWPVATVIDLSVLETLPEVERREGMAEVVKTGLLAGEPFWDLPDSELVRACAAYKTALCLRDPRDEGARAVLNLGHSFAHALETAAGPKGLSHGSAVALGLLAALRLSGRDTAPVEEALAPKPVRVDRERAWAALQRDKKARDGEIRLVLLRSDGGAVEAVPASSVRAALDELIQG